MHHSWRVIYYIGIALLGFCLLLLLFTMPETMYVRQVAQASTTKLDASQDDFQKNTHIEIEKASSEPAPPATKSYSQRHRLYNGTFTKESYLKLFHSTGLLTRPPSRPLGNAGVFRCSWILRCLDLERFPGLQDCVSV